MNPTENIRVDLTGAETIVVTREVTVAHWKAGMPEVFGTPFMIVLMEVAASNAVQSLLPAGWVSVGTEVNVKHLAATPVGRTVTARAKVTAVNERQITFEVEADDGFERIGAGTHVRTAIDLERFGRRLQTKRADGN